MIFGKVLGGHNRAVDYRFDFCCSVDAAIVLPPMRAGAVEWCWSYLLTSAGHHGLEHFRLKTDRSQGFNAIHEPRVMTLGLPP